MIAPSIGIPAIPPTSNPPNSSIAIGAIRVWISAVVRSLANAIVKLSRYSPSGSTHSSGIATISVVISVEVASISPDGTNASRIQCATRRRPGAGDVARGAASATGPPRGSVAAHSATSNPTRI